MKNREEKTVCVVWKGVVGIEQSITLCKELLTMFEKQDSITLSMSCVEDIDIAAIQIILSAIKESKKRSIPFSISGPVSEQVQAILKSVNIQLPVEEVAHV